eukprot:6469014-Amphidinium_carterae.1
MSIGQNGLKSNLSRKAEWMAKRCLFFGSATQAVESMSSSLQQRAFINELLGHAVNQSEDAEK